MPTPAVGADIESLCGKCGDVWHVVAAKVGEKVVKVVCKQCGNQHRHRPLDGATRGTHPSLAATEAGAPAPTRAPARARARASAKTPAQPEGPLVSPDPTRPVRRYHALEAYAAGDSIDHPTFGRGVVESSPGPGKVQVYFPSGRRILAAAKTAPTLGPAPARRGDE
jgi:hypothetical protein